jgi:hypothetical protein
MSQSPLSRHAGPIAVLAGAFFTITHLALFIVMDRSDLQAMTADPAFRVFNLAYAAAFSGLMIALVAAYDRQAREAGTLGLVALCAAIVGTVNLGADMWFEAFAAPWLVEVVPQVLTAEKTTIWMIGYLSSYLLFALGWVLFGLASLRARVFPAAVSLAIVVGGVIGFQAASPPYGVPLGLAILWLGAWMIRTRGATGAAADPARL